MSKACAATIVVLSGILLAPAPALALDLFCKPDDLAGICDTVPRDGLGNPDYNHNDPAKPWVIGKDDVITLPAGNYAPGNGPFGVPMVYLVENAILAVQDLPAGKEVSIGAWFVLCDQAQFHVKRAMYRSAAKFPFEYPMVAGGNSAVIFQEARIATVEKTLAEAGAPGALLMVMGGDSNLLVTPQTGKGVTFERVGEAWELAVVHNATATVRKAEVFGEFYIAGTAKLTVEDSQYFDLFFEACPGSALDIPALPALCTLGDPQNGCITAGHEPIDFTISPPETPFSLSFKNDKIFSWAVSTYEGSIVTMAAAPKDANVCLGLSMTGEQTLKLNPGDPPVHEGLNDRELAFNGTYVYGWHVWPFGTGTIELLAGSEVGDFVANDSIEAVARGVTFSGGMLVTQGQGKLLLEDCLVHELFQNIGGRARAVRTAFESTFSIAGPTWLADCTRPAPQLQDIRPEAKIYELALTAPEEGAEFPAGALGVEGSVKAVDGSGNTLDPFPAWTVELRGERGGGAQEFGAPADGAITSFDLSGLPYGEYEVNLYFSDSEGSAAKSTRKVTIGIPPDAGTHEDAGADVAEPEDRSDPSDRSGPPDAGAAADAGAKEPPASETAEGSEGGCSCTVIGL
ncbi:MAG: hypothetical protein HY897_15560 [Deltaproteobacteria bacterium]|nr:hypothetical protein [Deltaproteobacteria bacterium]